MKKISYYIFRTIKFIIWIFYPKISVKGMENMPSEPSIYVGNHSKTNGPIISELYFPTKHKTWCAAEMMKMKEVPSYAYRDFWHLKPKHTKWFYKLISYLIAPLCACVFSNADTIAVHHDIKIIKTIRQTVEYMQNGANIVIFPEYEKPYNHILSEFQSGFVDTARFYYKKTGRSLDFVPIYVAPNLKALYIGKGIKFNPQNNIENERKRICDYLSNEITEIATSLPLHTVIPYNNIPKKKYPTNKKEQNEKCMEPHLIISNSDSQK